jgi:DNA-binding CsgD family transcriptional regulator
MDLASHGWATVQIARGLGVSPRTVTGCLSGLFAALGVPNRAAMVAAGFRLGLLSPEPWRGRPRLDPSIQWLAPLLPLIALGRTDVEIAERFGCGAPTLRSRLFRLRELLGARDRGHAVRRGVEAGLLVVSPDGARLVLAGSTVGGAS